MQKNDRCYWTDVASIDIARLRMRLGAFLGEYF